MEGLILVYRKHRELFGGSFLKINQVEELVGITKKNIRFYEDEGLLNPERNPANGYREYSLKDVDVLLKIKFLRHLAIPIEEIRKLQNGSTEFEDVLTHQIDYYDKSIKDYSTMKDFCKEIILSNPSFEKIDAKEYLDHIKKMEAGGTVFMDIVKTDVAKKKTGSILSATVMITFFLTFLGFMIFAMTESTGEEPTIMFIVMIAFMALCVLGVVIALIQRLKEINGGEEDEANKY